MSDDINELVEQNNEGASPLKDSDQHFIQLNYKKLPLEQLCFATRLDPEVINQYIAEYENFLRERGINPDRKFTLNISLTPEGTIAYGLDWPDINSTEQMLDYIGKFFYLLNNGELKDSMVGFLNRYAEEKSAYKVIRSIITTWNTYEARIRDVPIVEPYEVFRD